MNRAAQDEKNAPGVAKQPPGALASRTMNNILPPPPAPPEETRYDLDANLGDLDLESCEGLVSLGTRWSRRNQAERTARLRAETACFFGDAPELEAIKSRSLAAVLALVADKSEPDTKKSV